ncbi:CsbD family protein [Sinorhizobium meliloti]|nr:CsbD family protein [Sinorhizobium meliloti]
MTDDDLDQIAGSRDQLEGKIQERYGIENDRSWRGLDAWYSQQRWTEFG